MKSIFSIFLGAALCLSATACSDVLDETPSSGYDKDNYFTTVERAEAAVLGVYASIASNTNYGWYQMALPASDDMHFTARTNNDNMIHDIAHYKVGVSNYCCPIKLFESR